MQQTKSFFSSYKNDINLKDIDVLHGVRVLFLFAVAWFHIWQQSWLSPTFTLFHHTISLDFIPRSGYMFVDGMLLLSGLLMYLPYVDKKEDVSPLLFYKKRMARIMPSYYLSVLLMLLFTTLSGYKYISTFQQAQDILSHLTFTHTFFPFSYLHTPLNVALWTLAIEMQFYLIFPLLQRSYKKCPVLTFSLMTTLAFLYRLIVSTRQDLAPLINQLPAFLDVYALGFFSAHVIVKIRQAKTSMTHVEKTFFTALSFLLIILLSFILKDQASSIGYEKIRLSQLRLRFPLSVCLSLTMICLCFSLPFVRFLLGNKAMRLCSSISFQYYIWHQVIAVYIKKSGWIHSISKTPWSAYEITWQIPYTFVCFIVPLVLSILLTYLFEKPLSRYFLKLRK